MSFSLFNFELTEEQKTWFGDRMHENASGRVIVPNHLYTKFKKITDNDLLSNDEIKTWLIDNVYNDVMGF